jgi:multidrug efflux pump subunit AcrA (membrane-fusion protein)
VIGFKQKAGKPENWIKQARREHSMAKDIPQMSALRRHIAIDDDLTTPVYSPYSGRVIELTAKLGDHVEPGVPLCGGDPARVWVAGEYGTIAERSVRVGQIADGLVEILAGLSQGEKDVTSAALSIDRPAGND